MRWRRGLLVLAMSALAACTADFDRFKVGAEGTDQDTDTARIPDAGGDTADAGGTGETPNESAPSEPAATVVGGGPLVTAGGGRVQNRSWTVDVSVGMPRSLSRVRNDSWRVDVSIGATGE